MSTQPSLFDIPTLWTKSGASRRSDPETSKAAAKSLDTNALESLVLETLRKHLGGLTSHEVASLTGLSLVTVSPRMAPLVRKGKICDSGERRSGVGFRSSTVWKCL
jgi:uncharacterized membrane protein